MMQVILSVVQFLMMDPYGVLILLMTALLLSRSSPQWLLTRMPGRRRDPTGKNVPELTVEMVHVAMMQDILSVVQFLMMDPYGVLILLLTALFLSRSSPQWLLTRMPGRRRDPTGKNA